MADKKITSIDLYDSQFVYLDDKMVLSNAWAGDLFSRHALPGALLFEGGESFSFLISDGRTLQLLKDSKVLWEGKSPDKVIDIIFDKGRNVFWLLSERSVSVFSENEKALKEVFSGKDLPVLRC